MSEKQPNSRTERCKACPGRSKLSKLLGRIASQENVTLDCEGPITVSRGNIVTQIRTGDEPAPERGTWNSLAASADPDGERRYSRIDWIEETMCGRVAVEPHDGEVPYDPSRPNPFVAKDGNRYAAFIKGDKEQIGDQRAITAISIGLNNNDV